MASKVFDELLGLPYGSTAAIVLMLQSYDEAAP